MRVLFPVLLLGFAAVVAIQIRAASQDTALLRRAQWQTAELFRDVIEQNQSAAAPLHTDRTAAKLVFSKDSPVLAEYVDRGDGWRQTRPRGDVSLSLPNGVVISSWGPSRDPFMLVLKDWNHGVGVVRIVRCIVTLTSPAGAHADVHVEEDGRVWYR